MSGHRQAAAAIHGLSVRDRGLILAELPASDQQVLRGYLTELDELGFERTELHSAHADRLPQARPPIDPAPQADAASTIRVAGSAAMLDVLGQEPATLIAHFLCIEAWPWTADFMELLVPARRTLVRSALETSGIPASARARFLMDAAATALGPSQAHATVRPSRLGALLAKATAWKR